MFIPNITKIRMSVYRVVKGQTYPLDHVVNLLFVLQIGKVTKSSRLWWACSLTTAMRFVLCSAFIGCWSERVFYPRTGHLKRRKWLQSAVVSFSWCRENSDTFQIQLVNMLENITMIWFLEPLITGVCLNRKLYVASVPVGFITGLRFKSF